MDDQTLKELSTLIADLRGEVRSLSERLTTLEQRQDGGASAAKAAGAPAEAAPAAVAAAAPAAAAEATEEDLLVISAAVAAFLGVRARIRHVRLIQSSSWVQVGRATVHASHRVH